MGCIFCAIIIHFFVHFATKKNQFFYPFDAFLNFFLWYFGKVLSQKKILIKAKFRLQNIAEIHKKFERIIAKNWSRIEEIFPKKHWKYWKWAKQDKMDGKLTKIRNKRWSKMHKKQVCYKSATLSERNFIFQVAFCTFFMDHHAER